MYTTIKNRGKHEVDPPLAHEINHTPTVDAHDGLSPQRSEILNCVKILMERISMSGWAGALCVILFLSFLYLYFVCVRLICLEWVLLSRGLGLVLRENVRLGGKQDVLVLTLLSLNLRCPDRDRGKEADRFLGSSRLLGRERAEFKFVSGRLEGAGCTVGVVINGLINFVRVAISMISTLVGDVGTLVRCVSLCVGQWLGGIEFKPRESRGDGSVEAA